MSVSSLLCACFWSQLFLKRKEWNVRSRLTAWRVQSLGPGLQGNKAQPQDPLVYVAQALQQALEGHTHTPALAFSPLPSCTQRGFHGRPRLRRPDLTHCPTGNPRRLSPARSPTACIQQPLPPLAAPRSSSASLGPCKLTLCFILCQTRAQPAGGLGFYLVLPPTPGWPRRACPALSSGQ